MSGYKVVRVSDRSVVLETDDLLSAAEECDEHAPDSVVIVFAEQTES